MYFSGRSIKPKHLSCTNLKPCIQNRINYLPNIVFGNDMRFYDQTRAIIKVSRGLDGRFIRKEKFNIFDCSLWRVTSMNYIFAKLLLND